MDDMVFSFVDTERGAKIKVIGAGGAGGNAVNNMIAANLTGVQFIVANTDLQALESSKAPIKIQIGRKLTDGLGAGANPDVGREAARESRDAIKEAVEGCHMVFITAGLGGGTGTGAAPVIAEVCKELGILTVAVVTKPFMFEARKRTKVADQGLATLREMADTVITIPNDRLRSLASPDARAIDMFKKADEVLLHSVRGITDLIMKTGYVNLDFADVRATMSKAGMALMGIGIGEGENRAILAAERALYHPLLEDISISGARGVLVNITCGSDLTMAEMTAASDRIYEEAGDDAEIIWGAVVDDTIGNELRVTLIATGIGDTRQKLPRCNAGSADEKAAAIAAGREAAPARGEVRDLTADDAQGNDDWDMPTYIRRKKKAVGETHRSNYRGFVDGDELDTPTFLRKPAD
jgi:cell division protein FtsZ